MKNLKFNRILFLLFISIFIFSCESEDDVNEKTSPNISAVSFAKSNNIVTVTPENNIFKLMVTTTKAYDTDKSVDIVLDTDNSTGISSDYTLDSSTITIPAGELFGYASLTFNYDNLISGLSKSLIYNLEVPDDLIKNVTLQNTKIKYSRPCEENLLVLDIHWLDKYSEETSWDITDSSGTVLFSNSYSRGPDGGMEVTELICLPVGNYTLNFYDSYGDGLGSGGDFSLKLGETILASGSGDFGSSLSIPFVIQ